LTAGFVADSSLAVAWVIPAQSIEVSNRLRDDIQFGTPFFVPVLWMFEVANTLLVLTRRRKIDSQQCSQARRYLGDLGPFIDEEGPRLALGKILELAEKYALSVYDATYLELALRRGLPLASRDAELNKAAKSSGVETFF
jgi:predicted nucleic acid-binding protein